MANGKREEMEEDGAISTTPSPSFLFSTHPYLPPTSTASSILSKMAPRHSSHRPDARLPFFVVCSFLDESVCIAKINSSTRCAEAEIKGI